MRRRGWPSGPAPNETEVFTPTLYLTPGEKGALLAAREETGLYMRDICREALDEWLEGRGFLRDEDWEAPR